MKTYHEVKVKLNGVSTMTHAAVERIDVGREGGLERGKIGIKKGGEKKSVLLGQGGFGRVVAYGAEAERHYVLKKMTLQGTRKDDFANLVGEILKLMVVNGYSEYTFYLKDAAETKAYVFMPLVRGAGMRIMEGGKPDNKYDKCDNRNKVTQLVHIFYQILDWHYQQIAHWDLKPENVLIEANGKARLIDFGSASRIENVPEWPRPKGISPQYNLSSISEAIHYLSTLKHPTNRDLLKVMDEQRPTCYVWLNSVAAYKNGRPWFKDYEVHVRQDIFSLFVMFMEMNIHLDAEAVTLAEAVIRQNFRPAPMKRLVDHLKAVIGVNSEDIMTYHILRGAGSVSVLQAPNTADLEQAFKDKEILEWDLQTAAGGVQDEINYYRTIKRGFVSVEDLEGKEADVKAKMDVNKTARGIFGTLKTVTHIYKHDLDYYRAGNYFTDKNKLAQTFEKEDYMSIMINLLTYCYDHVTLRDLLLKIFSVAFINRGWINKEFTTSSREIFRAVSSSIGTRKAIQEVFFGYDLFKDIQTFRNGSLALAHDRLIPGKRYDKGTQAEYLNRISKNFGALLSDNLKLEELLLDLQMLQKIFDSLDPLKRSLLPEHSEFLENTLGQMSRLLESRGNLFEMKLAEKKLVLQEKMKMLSALEKEKGQLREQIDRYLYLNVNHTRISQATLETLTEAFNEEMARLTVVADPKLEHEIRTLYGEYIGYDHIPAGKPWPKDFVRAALTGIAPSAHSLYRNGADGKYPDVCSQFAVDFGRPEKNIYNIRDEHGLHQVLDASVFKRLSDTEKPAKIGEGIHRIRSFYDNDARKMFLLSQYANQSLTAIFLLVCGTPERMKLCPFVLDKQKVLPAKLDAGIFTFSKHNHDAVVTIYVRTNIGQVTAKDLRTRIALDANRSYLEYQFDLVFRPGEQKPVIGDTYLDYRFVKG